MDKLDILGEYTGNEEDNEKQFNISDLNLTKEQQANIYNMVEHNEIQAMEKRARVNEYQKKYLDKIKQSKPPKQPRTKKLMSRDEITFCKFCNKDVKHYYLHSRTKGHQIIEKLTKERDETLLLNKVS